MLNTNGDGVTKDNKIHIKGTRFTQPDLDRNMNSNNKKPGIYDTMTMKL